MVVHDMLTSRLDVSKWWPLVLQNCRSYPLHWLCYLAGWNVVLRYVYVYEVVMYCTCWIGHLVGHVVIVWSVIWSVRCRYVVYNVRCVVGNVGSLVGVLPDVVRLWSATWSVTVGLWLVCCRNVVGNVVGTSSVTSRLPMREWTTICGQMWVILHAVVLDRVACCLPGTVCWTWAFCERLALFCTQPSKHVVLPLHSMLPMGNQHFVFDRWLHFRRIRSSNTGIY